MLSVGFSYTLRELLEPLRNTRLLIGALVANFVLVPLLAYVITQFLSLGEGREIGLFLVATAAGAPFLIKLTQAADVYRHAACLDHAPAAGHRPVCRRQV
jgi:BASS family bile acid:Na+ symporter